LTGLVTSSDHILIGATRMATDHVEAAVSDLERYLGIEV
jgi:hypothetical protein